jgi:hypothetical protein
MKPKQQKTLKDMKNKEKDLFSLLNRQRNKIKIKLEHLIKVKIKKLNSE